MRLRNSLLLALSASITLTACGDKQTTESAKVEAAPFWPQITSEVQPDAQVEKRVEDILQGMTLEQKVAQVIQPEIRDITVEDMRRYGFGSYLNGGGAFPNNDKHATPEDWVALAEAMYQASVDDSQDGSSIPTMWGTDAVHGHNNVIGATLFPHNIGLGAANNPALIEKIAKVTATEVAVTGIDWIFAPTVAVTRDDRWGRTYEAYSEDPQIVRDYSYAIVKGLQGQNEALLDQYHVISTVKHFLGDGGTEKGDDQGDNLASERELYEIHAQGYVGGLTAGAQSVMASFNSWHGVKNHGNEYLLTTVLKDRMGFDGFVVGDWNGHGQVKGCSNESCPKAFNAGLDVFMVPTQAWKPLMENTIAQVKSGEISMARLDDAVSRVLRVKVRAGLFDKPSPAKRALAAKVEYIGHDDHRAIARQAVRESLVLLKNNNQLLPLKPQQNILLAGDGADNIGKQSGGWTITWQGTGNKNEDFPGATSIYQGIKSYAETNGGSVELAEDGSFTQKPDVAIVVFGEEPYAEGNGDIANLEYQRGDKKDLALLKKLKAQGIPVVSVFLSGRPLWVNAELNASDAFVAAWLPGSEGQGIADVLLANTDGTARFDFTGKLSFSWPADANQATVNRFDQDYQPLLPYGFGMSYGDSNTLSNALDESVSTSSAAQQQLSLFGNSINAPWQLRIGAIAATQDVVSNVQQSGPVSLRTIDRNVQEDARQLTFDGSTTGEVSIGASFPSDLRDFDAANSALRLDIKANSKTTRLLLGMACGDNCQSMVDISKQMSAGNQWQSLQLPLSCISNNVLAAAFAPFVLRTDEAVTLSIANIRVDTIDREQPILECPVQ